MRGWISTAWRAPPITGALHEFSELSDFEAKVPELLKQEGPVFATLHLKKGALSPQFDYRRLDDPARRVAFRAALLGS